jgi:septum formation protein
MVKRRKGFRMVNDYKIILASNSPRRRELLAGLGIEFEVRVLPGIDESYPASMPAAETAEYIAGKKAAAYRQVMADDELVITADTVVIVGDEVLGKPADTQMAAQMLRKLSGRTHQVMTGVCMTTSEQTVSFSVKTDVTFKQLAEDEIEYYIKKYQPLDKAGAYGIQEWIGYIGCTGLNGSYYNVMGLPVQRIYTELQRFTRRRSLPDCQQ